MPELLSVLRRRACLPLVLLLFLLLSPGFSARGEVSVAFSPSAPRAGELVEVTVSCDASDVRGVVYRLMSGGKTLSRSKSPQQHFTAFFRPRLEREYVLEVTAVCGGNVTEITTVSIPVSGTAPPEMGPDVIYSQRDGWWKDKKYSVEHNRTVESSGCAVFALSHALQRMGYTGESVLPDQLAYTYHKCYIEGTGSSIEALVTQAALDFGFLTFHKTVTDRQEITAFFRRGDLFVLGIVKGHAALADRMDESAGMVHIVDSAPGTSFSKFGRTEVFVREEDGSYRQVSSPEELPGIRWYLENSDYGGAEYWLRLESCAGLNLRILRKPWLTLISGEAGSAAQAEWMGTVQSAVRIDGKLRTVNTRDLSWNTLGEEQPKLALVTKQAGAVFTDRKGTALKNFRPMPWGRTVPVLWAEPDRVYICYRGTFGYLRREDVSLMDAAAEDPPSAQIAGRSTLRGHTEPDIKSPAAGEWAAGDVVFILEQEDGFCLVEGGGLRGWVPADSLSAKE